MRITYLLLFPLDKKLPQAPTTRLKSLKRGPYFLDIDIDKKSLERKELEVDGQKIFQSSFVYDDLVNVLQFDYEVGEDLKEDLLDKKTKINSQIKDVILSEYGPKEGTVEEYTILFVNKPGKINDFVAKNKFLLARFMRSLDKEISKDDADEILVSQVSYSKDDLVIVDWEGAIVIDTDSDFDSQLELLKIGNYQLLRYRILDKMIEKSLEGIRKAITQPKKKFTATNYLRTAIENKLSLLLDFDKVDQSLLLVGDWYSAKLYKKIIEEFYIDDWRILVKNKLDNLETIDATARQNLVFNWGRLLDIVQIVGWMVLLIGYFFLYYIDLQAIK